MSFNLSDPCFPTKAPRLGPENTGIQLRALLGLFSVLIFVAGCSWDDGKSAPRGTRSLTVVTYGGGTYQDSHKNAYCRPFEDITGCKIDSVVWGAEYGKLKSMVSEGRVPWDVVEVTAGQFKRGKDEGLFEKLVIKPTAGEFLKDSVQDYGVANLYWATVLAFPKERFTGRQPTDWKDFWDVETFPGPRALYDDPRGNLEFALLADGVRSEKLYPLDLDRAFKKLEQIKPHVKVWWTDSTLPLQDLMKGTVVMSSAWNGRIFASKEAQSKIAYSWSGAALEVDYWIVPRGSKNVDTASRFILFASMPWTMAKQIETLGYGPSNQSGAGPSFRGGSH